MADNINTGDDIHSQYVIFQVSGNKFAVNCKFVTSIENTGSIKNINNTEDTKIFDLRELLWGETQTGSIKPKPDFMEHIIILRVKDKNIGIMVDAAENIEQIDEIQGLPASVVTGEYIKKAGLGKKDHEIIYIFEPEAFE